MIRRTLLVAFLALLAAPTTYARGQGQLPGTLPPAPAVIPPPPPVAPAQVPPSVGAGTVAPLSPLRSPTYGTYGGSSTLRYIYDPKPPAKKRLKFRRRHHS